MDMFNESKDIRQIQYQILKYRSTDLMTDRDRAKFLGLPEGCRIRENAKILEPKKFKCGKHIWIGEGAILDAQGGLEIGDFTQVGLYVLVWSHTTHKQALKGETCISKESITYKPTKIGSHCFIAGHSVIAPGITIGDKVIISPGSFVDCDLPDGSIFSNNKRYRDLEKRILELEAKIEEIEGKIK